MGRDLRKTLVRKVTENRGTTWYQVLETLRDRGVLTTELLSADPKEAKMSYQARFNIDLLITAAADARNEEELSEAVDELCLTLHQAGGKETIINEKQALKASLFKKDGNGRKADLVRFVVAKR